jgi:hypothetical protein
MRQVSTGSSHILLRRNAQLRLEQAQQRRSVRDFSLYIRSTSSTMWTCRALATLFLVVNYWGTSSNEVERLDFVNLMIE